MLAQVKKTNKKKTHIDKVCEKYKKGLVGWGGELECLGEDDVEWYLHTVAPAETKR